MKAIRALAAIVVVLALPAGIGLTNLRWLALDANNYLPLQQQNAVPQTAGLTPAELLKIDRGTVFYFQSDRDSLPDALARAGVSSSLYSERDKIHWVDVHDMVSKALTVHWVSLVLVIAILVVALLAGAHRWVARSVMFGGILTIAILGLLGITAFFFWDALFLAFHLLSFANDFWQLDPARDAMIRLYPPGFFMDATIELALMSAAEALILATVAGLYMRRSPKKAWSRA